MVTSQSSFQFPVKKQFSYHRRSGVGDAAPGLVEPHLGGHVLQVDAAGLGVGLGWPPDEEEPVHPEEPLPEPDKRKPVFKKEPKTFLDVCRCRYSSVGKASWIKIPQKRCN